MLRLLAIACLASPTSAAECVSADDLATGIVFEQQQLGRGLIQTVEGNRLRTTYTSSSSAQGEESVALWGIYSESYHVWNDGAGLATPQDWTDSFRFSVKPPLPEAGLNWSAKITRKRKGEIDGETVTDKATEAVSFTYDAPRSVTFGSCDYAVMTVTGRFTAEGVDFIRRYAYFPDLGFGLQTRWVDNTLFEAEDTHGITALSPRP